MTLRETANMNALRFVAPILHTAAAGPIPKEDSGTDRPGENNAFPPESANPRGMDSAIADDGLQTRESVLRALLDDAHARLRDAGHAQEAMKAFVASLPRRARRGRAPRELKARRATAR
jgi:hypothetical protein